MRIWSFIGGVTSGLAICVLGLVLVSMPLPRFNLETELPDLPDFELPGSGEMHSVELPEKEVETEREPGILRKGTAARVPSDRNVSGDPTRRAIPGFARGHTDAMRVTVDRARQTQNGVLVTMVFRSDSSGMKLEDFERLKLFLSHRMCTHRVAMRLFEHSRKAVIELKDPAGGELYRFRVKTLIC